MFAKRLGGILVGTLLTTLVVAACGGGEKSTPTPAPRPTGAPTATPAAPAPTPVPGATPAPTATRAPLAPAPTTTPAPAPTITAAAVPKYGGVMAVRISSSSLSEWDNYTPVGFASILITQNLLNNITHIDASDGSTIRPDLAERWAYSQDGKSITYNLRRGALWHDGRPFTARDVVSSLERARNPTDPVAGLHKVRLGVIQSVEQPDDLTVRVNLSRTSASALTVLSVGNLTIYPTHVASIAAWKANPFGTGPFRLKSFQRDTSAEFLRNDQYFKKDEAGQSLPYLNGLSFVWILDQSLGLSAFRTGRLSCACGYGDIVASQRQQIAEAVKGVKFSSTWNINSLHFNVAKPPFNDLKVRQAMHIALNRVDLAQLVHGGVGFYPPTYLRPPEVGGKLSLPTEEWLRTPGFRQPKELDLELARQLFREAGVEPSSISVRVFYPGSLLHVREALASVVLQLGVKASLQIPATAADRAAILSRGDFDLYFNSNGNIFDDPADIVASSVQTGGPLNYGKYSNPKVDQLLAAQDAELDPGKRLQLLIELQRLLLNDAAFVPAHHFGNITALHPYVEGMPPSNAFPVGAHHRFELVWFNQ